MRQVHLWFRQENIALPVVRYSAEERRSIAWRLPVYNCTMSRFNEARAVEPGKTAVAEQDVVAARRASMRPGLLGPGRPACRGRSTSRRCSFNEALAVGPGKTPKVRRPAAGALQASMRPGLLGPGRRGHITSLRVGVGVASMRPGLLGPGRPF